MIVRLQNRVDIRTFCEPYVTQNGAAYAVFMRTRWNGGAVECGRYLEESRAKGVLLEMILAYQRQERVFYMPDE